MANLFDYATKELSQDAFLRWLFESYEDEEVKPYADFLLRKFCNLGDSGIITDVKTAAQWCKIDIEVKFNVNGEKHALYIEDKTYSEAHEQLKKYNEKIEQYQKEYKVSKIFYKTYLISKKDRVETTDAGWMVYDIDDIYKIFNSLPKSNNQILNQYIEHISNLYTSTHNSKKPDRHDSTEDLLKWESYFKYISEGIIKGHEYKEGGVWKAGRFPYMCIVFRKDRYAPYLEIRSKDCLNNKFEAVILCYGIAEKDDNEKPFTAEQVKIYQSILLKKIQNDNFFSTKGVLHNPNGYNKQLGRYVPEKEIISDEDFIAELEKCACYYDELMVLWNIILTEELSKEEYDFLSNQLDEIAKWGAICFSQNDIGKDVFSKSVEAFKHFYHGGNKSKLFLWNILKEDDVTPEIIKSYLTADELAFYTCWWKQKQYSLEKGYSLKNSVDISGWKNINYLKTKKLILNGCTEDDEKILKNDFLTHPDDYYSYTLKTLIHDSGDLEYHTNLKHSYTFSIRHKKSGRFLGVVKLFESDNIPDVISKPCAEMAYYILSEERGKGYAKQAIQEILSAVKSNRLKRIKSTNKYYIYEEEPLHINSVFIRPLSDNIPSQNLAQSVGFSYIKEISEEHSENIQKLKLYTFNKEYN